MNKTQAVLEHLKNHVGITSMEAIDLYGATRLSAIIFNLRKYGYNIKSQLLKLLVIFPATSALAAWICTLF